MIAERKENCNTKNHEKNTGHVPLTGMNSNEVINSIADEAKRK